MDPDEPRRTSQVLILNKLVAKSSVEITNETLAEANHLYITMNVTRAFNLQH